MTIGIAERYNSQKLSGTIQRGTYKTTDIVFETSQLIQIIGVPSYLTSLYVYLNDDVVGLRYVMVFDGTISPVVSGDVPVDIGDMLKGPTQVPLQISAGQTVIWEPPLEFKTKSGDFLGFPFSSGIVVGISTEDEDWIPSNAPVSEIRIMARYAVDPCFMR